MRASFNSLPDATNTTEFKVGFFNIQPGERAIVRFAIESDNDFDIYTLHTVENAEKKQMKVDCIRDLRDTVDKCPFCKNNIKIEQKCYIKLIRYYQNSDGTFTPKAQVWERNVRSSIVNDLRNYLNDYGDLSAIVCAITRTGTGLDTKYTISPNLPNASIYPIDWSAFNDYSVLGGIVKSWDAQQMSNFLMTGEIPQRQTVEAQPMQSAYVVNETMVVTPEMQNDLNNGNLPFNDSMPQPAYSSVSQTSQPIHNAQINENRPKRIYN